MNAGASTTNAGVSRDYRWAAWLTRPVTGAMISGVTLAAAFPRLALFPLAWIALVPLLISVARNNQTCKTARAFFLAGWIFHSIHLQWLMANIMWAGGWALIGQQLLCVALALHWAGVGALWTWSARRWPRRRWVILPPLWLAMEWLMARWLSGFGWSALAYSQGSWSVAQWAAAAGVDGVSFLVITVNTLTAAALTEGGKPRWRRLVAAAGVLAVAVAGGMWLAGTAVPAPGSPLFRAAVFQTAFAQETKWDPDFAETLFSIQERMTRSLVAARPVDLVVWPEAAVYEDLSRPATRDRLIRLAKETGAALCVGGSRVEHGNDYNSAVLATSDGGYAWYDKVHLAPFGEYIPFETWLPFPREIAFGGVAAGTEQRVFDLHGTPIGPLICFEVLFAPMARRLERMGARALVVMTNLGWFGASNVTAQELEIARFRAIENRVSLLHSGNTGISGMFDPLGRFTPVHVVFYGNEARFYDPTRIEPAMVYGRRMAGVFDVPPPALKPGLPWRLALPLLAVLLALLESLPEKRS
ncbi:MAG TPA: apolipoprotein N-acyltransferase [Candidatus Hydrogenedentes bacterium]|nr:apolipoprotein N-acyltransferase [Candidatus Hydrogenedentota bacterium]HOV61286.1 apolipoprotein N-acyltransferase [Candidatus Hydrogenedentota bacterium]